MIHDDQAVGFFKVVWVHNDQTHAIPEWIDANCTATRYTTGDRAIIILFFDETDFLMFKLRFP